MRFILAGILFLYGAVAVADCGQLADGKTRYCIELEERSPDVLFYFHGRFGSAEKWQETNNYTEQLREEWRSRGVLPPTVVSVSLGPVWLLAEKNESSHSGLFEYVRDQVLPELERKIGGVRGRRLLLGESMGGFNVLQLGLKTRQFAKVAALCAPIPLGADPFSGPDEIESWIVKSTAYSYYGEKRREEIDGHVAEMVEMGRRIWLNRENWQRSDPLALADKADKNLIATEFYLAAGFYDPYVLYEGNAELARRLKDKGIAAEWRPQWGGHCAIDIPSLSRFLTP